MPCSGCGQSGHNIRTCGRGSSGGGYSSGGSYSSNASYLGSLSSYIVPEVKRTVHCGNCGGAGHNIRTCSAIKSSSIYTSSASTPTLTRVIHCSICGGVGHNKATCSINLSVTSKPSITKSTSSTNTSSQLKRVVHCSVCGEEGHNRRTCSQNKVTLVPNKPASSSVGTKRVIHCSECGKEGHNKTTCPQIKSYNNMLESFLNARQSSYEPTFQENVPSFDTASSPLEQINSTSNQNVMNELNNFKKEINEFLNTWLDKIEERIGVIEDSVNEQKEEVSLIKTTLKDYGICFDSAKEKGSKENEKKQKSPIRATQYEE